MNLVAYINTYHLHAVTLDTYGSQSQQARVSIEIFDTATGQPTNGNNCRVTYRVTDEYGNTSVNTVTVPGMKLVIYEGEIGRVNFNSSREVLSSTLKSFDFVSVTEGDGGAIANPLPLFSEIRINSVTVARPESAPGAANGEITVDAYSNYLPLAYQLNGSLTQSSPVFTGLAGGNYTITVIDSADYALNRSVFVPTVNSLLQADPTVTLPGGNVSRWNAAFNPVVFTYQRKDFAVTSLQLHTETGTTRVSVDADIAAVQPGDRIYIETPVCTGTYSVTSIYSPAAYLPAVLVIDAPFTANSTGFININRLRPYYKMLTRISFFDKITGRQSNITSTNRPNNRGIIRADLSNFLQSLLRAKDESDYTQTNHRDLNLSASYQVSYAEHWDDDTPEGHTTTYSSIDHPFYVVYAAKQLGELYGGNLAAYVPFASTPNGAGKARWITDFAEPAYSNGYPFDISFIYSDDLVGRELYAELTLLDINRSPLPGGTQSSYLLNEDGSWLLNSDGSRLVIARQSQSVLPVPGQLGLNRLLVKGPFSDEVYYISLILKYNDEDGIAHAITQTQTIRMDDAVDDQSIYLRWIGLSGSWNYYRFVYNQEVSLDVQNAVIIKNYVSDWANQDSIEEVISKTAGQKVKVMAEDLSVADIKGLQSIKYSPKVQMLVNKNPVKWQTIVINTATYSEYETRNGQAPFSLTFNLPAINIQAQ
ncbi:hypothetical protein [Mucilaginibacter phyllosphaerae]|uniref:Uncharacterized protein n=1 Tax=Mucilaginibacter phyllosphaerae TaxID=1812349 RepID=A0A4Y8AJK5_9SPHI|nr:hypothetical protein [Mucilaginibacter phyllosphaerae]MBB3967739.1 hypothetical protein [Mucilaginibacter phyllosphaerae]TEW69210.1 hypothetical protein E2R65_03315 [Mucilaginibacter phyllosphaerae]GGH03659.1 hypothetical protein GCM10007352_06420 [Mucilaginibacter phyllosphaerae]